MLWNTCEISVEYEENCCGKTQHYCGKASLKQKFRDFLKERVAFPNFFAKVRGNFNVTVSPANLCERV